MNIARSRRPLLMALLMCIIAGSGLSAQAQTQRQDPDKAAAAEVRQKLRVATKPAPPFAMQTEDGKWSGMAIELFEEIAGELGRDIEWRNAETSDGVVEAVAAGTADAGVAAVSITAEREKTVDFSHAYYESGLAIAIASNRASGLWDVIRALGSPAFLATVSMLGLLLLVTGAIIWFVEKGRNKEQFQDDPVEGIGNGFWWAAVTMTTVGYGDKAPITPVGRAIAVVWMFAALILTAVFTAQLTTALTLEGISGPVSGPNDLAHARVGIVAESATADYFGERFIRTRKFKDVESGLAALSGGSIDAFVHDEPILRYTVLREFGGRVELLPQVFEPQGYGIVVEQSSDLREGINRALLDVLDSVRWSGIRKRYLGEAQ